jgi:hypothetical protein
VSAAPSVGQTDDARCQPGAVVGLDRRGVDGGIAPALRGHLLLGSGDGGLSQLETGRKMKGPQRADHQHHRRTPLRVGGRADLHQNIDRDARRGGIVGMAHQLARDHGMAADGFVDGLGDAPVDGGRGGGHAPIDLGSEGGEDLWATHMPPLRGGGDGGSVLRGERRGRGAPVSALASSKLAKWGSLRSRPARGATVCLTPARSSSLRCMAALASAICCAVGAGAACCDHAGAAISMALAAGTISLGATLGKRMAVLLSRKLRAPILIVRLEAIMGQGRALHNHIIYDFFRKSGAWMAGLPSEISGYI